MGIREQCRYERSCKANLLARSALRSDTANLPDCFALARPMQITAVFDGQTSPHASSKTPKAQLGIM